MAAPGPPDEAVAEDERCAHLGRECAEHADFEIDLSLAARIGILFGLGREAIRAAGPITITSIPNERTSFRGASWNCWPSNCGCRQYSIKQIE
jgi:hypothetical protein